MVAPPCFCTIHSVSHYLLHYCVYSSAHSPSGLQPSWLMSWQWFRFPHLLPLVNSWGVRILFTHPSSTLPHHSPIPPIHLPLHSTFTLPLCPLICLLLPLSTWKKILPYPPIWLKQLLPVLWWLPHAAKRLGATGQEVALYVQIQTTFFHCGDYCPSFKIFAYFCRLRGPEGPPSLNKLLSSCPWSSDLSVCIWVHIENKIHLWRGLTHKKLHIQWSILWFTLLNFSAQVAVPWRLVSIPELNGPGNKYHWEAAEIYPLPREIYDVVRNCFGSF